MNAHLHKGFEVGAAGDEAAPPPKGRHLMEIIDSDSFTHRGETELKFQAQLISGQHKGCLLDFAMDVTRHFEVDDEGYEAETAKAERGDRQYAALRWATGVFDPKYTDDLHNKPFVATVSYRNGSYRVDGFDRPRPYGTTDENAPAPKQAKPTPPRGPDGRFLKAGHTETAPELAQTAKPWEKTHHGSDLSTDPETVPYERYSACFQRFDKLSQISFKMKMQWGLLGPLIADQLGRGTGPLNGLLKGGGDGLYVLAAEDAELMDYHLAELGSLIDEMHAADVA